MKKPAFLTFAMLLAMLFMAFGASAQSPVQWKASCKMVSKTEGIITLTATIDKGWHIYGLEPSDDGPVNTTVDFTGSKGVTFKGTVKASPAPVNVMDEVFEAKVTYWENKVSFSRRFRLGKVKTATATVSVNYMCCDDTSCRPPCTEKFTVKIK